MRIAFFHDERFIAVWDELRDLYDLDGVFEIEGPGENENTVTGWGVIGSVDEIPDGVTLVAFQPEDSPTFPGTVSLADFAHPSGNVVYLFGADDRHNDPVDCSAVVYVNLPRHHALWSFQAAAIVLHDRHVRGTSG